MDYKTHKGIRYYPTFDAARSVSAILAQTRPANLPREQRLRIVEYQRGWAVQYRESGPYFPEAE